MDMSTQQNRLLSAMKNTPGGVNSFFATYGMSIKQAPTRIKELKQKGFNIKSIANKDMSVNWILLNKSKAEMKKMENLKPIKHFIFEGNVALEVSEEEYSNLNKPIQQSFI